MSDDPAAASVPIRLWRDAKRAIDRIEPQRGTPSTSPIGRYLDPDRHALELRALRRLPHAIGPVSRLTTAGDWLSTQLLGVPVVAVRGSDGEVRAFINVCRHRGALVVPPNACGAGKARFVCPYHSWTYDDRGALVGRPHEADFAHVPQAEAGLVPLPVTERFGLVWVVPERTEAFDWAGYFGAMGAELEGLGYGAAAASPHERRFEQPANWKLLLDANLESYHFQYAHRETIAHLFHDNVVQHASFGEHQRIVLPKRSLEGDAPEAAAAWNQLGRHSNIIYFFFPSTYLLWEGDHANVFNLTPLAPAATLTASWMLVPPAFAAARPAAHWARNWQIYWDAIDEDFALAASMQRGLGSGANTELRFGSNEFACDLFERAVEARLDEL